MDKESAVNIMRKWYSQKHVLFEMFFSGMNLRETAVLTPKVFLEQDGLKGVRYLRVSGTDGLNYMLYKMLKFDSEEKPLNIYNSLAKYKHGVPVMSPVLRFRNVEIKQWIEKMNAMVFSYDCLIDVDSPDHANMLHAKEVTFRVKNHLDKYKVPYHLRFSGMGYHLIIPYDAFYHLDIHLNPDEEIERSIYLLYNTITKRLNELYGEMIDTDLHDSRRITKVPYSLALYADGCFVCWPFNSHMEFITKTWKDFLLDGRCNFAGEEHMFRRGQKLFNEREWTAEGINQFLKSLSIQIQEKEKEVLNDGAEVQASTTKQTT